MNWLLLYVVLLKATVTSFSGLASLPIIRDELVVKRHVLTDEQLNMSIVVTRTTPGPVGLYVVSVGYFADGLPGGGSRLAGHVHTRASDRSSGSLLWPQGRTSTRQSRVAGCGSGEFGAAPVGDGRGGAKRGHKLGDGRNCAGSSAGLGSSENRNSVGDCRGCGGQLGGFVLIGSGWLAAAWLCRQ